MPRPHGWVADFQVQYLLGTALLDERADGLLDNQAHERVRRVVTARPFARKDVEPHVDPALLLHQLTFQQPLVNRPKLFHAQVAIIDVALALQCGVKGQGINHIGYDLITQSDIGQKRCVFLVEQAAVVRWQANGGVALVDDAAQVADGRPVASGRIGEYIALLLALAHVVAHSAQAVVVIRGVAHGQQVAVFGVEDEQ